MEKCHAIPRPTSPRCETDVRPSDSSPPVLEKLRAGLAREHFLVIDQLWQTFRVPASGIGLIALAHEIARDLSLLSRILPQFSVPEWSSCIGAVIPSVSSLLSTDATRDLSALLNLPRQSLRYFLAPIDKRVPVPQARLMRALRVLLSLGMLAGKEELATKFAQEFARWLAGDYPANLRPDTLTQTELAQIAANQSLRPDAVKILNHLASTLRSELLNPFEDPAQPKDFYSAPQPKEQHGAPDEDNEKCAEISGQKDILRAAIAAQATATCGANSLYAATFHPFTPTPSSIVRTTPSEVRKPPDSFPSASLTPRAAINCARPSSACCQSGKKRPPLRKSMPSCAT